MNPMLNPYDYNVPFGLIELGLDYADNATNVHPLDALEAQAREDIAEWAMEDPFMLLRSLAVRPERDDFQAEAGIGMASILTPMGVLEALRDVRNGDVAAAYGPGMIENGPEAIAALDYLIAQWESVVAEGWEHDDYLEHVEMHAQDVNQFLAAMEDERNKSIERDFALETSRIDDDDFDRFIGGLAGPAMGLE